MRLTHFLTLYNSRPFVQASPATGTLYDVGSTDGTYTYTLTQPDSPDLLTQMRGGWRVASVQEATLGKVNTGWEWLLEVQEDGSYTFSWYHVDSGTPEAAITTVTDIGTVTNVKVVLSGTSITVSTSANGTDYTPRDSTTSSSQQDQTNLTASYTGVDDDAFYDDDWTDSGNYTDDDPNNWTVSTEDASNYVTETANGMQFVSDGSSWNITRESPAATGEDALLLVNIFAYTTNGIRPRTYNDLAVIDTLTAADGTGLQAMRFARGSNTGIRITGTSNDNDVTIARTALFPIGALDNGSDGISEIARTG